MTSEYRDIYTVSRLNSEARALLEGSFPLLWVEGEISNFACPASGHWYFSLKDQNAQVRCAMFRNRNAHLGFVPKNGMQVLIRTRISLYEARGDFQLIAEHMEEAGDGALRRAFDELKNRLQQEGLFAVEHKKPLPSHIQTIGVITSPSGAAIRDILTTLKRRYPSARVIIYPVAVQGGESASQISSMIRTVDNREECDVILLTRGGGSLEDLWSFNEEVVARAIFDCSIPIVCGVGHEVDVTIADLVADFRAATPTAAAEMVSLNQHELRTRLLNNTTRLGNAITRQLRQQQQRISWLIQRIKHPGRQIQQLEQRLDDMQLRLNHVQAYHMRHLMMHLNVTREKLIKLHPMQSITINRQHLGYLSHQLEQLASLVVKTGQQQFLQLTKTLNAVSPLATLERGYAIVTDSKTSDVLRDAGQVKKGDMVKARLHRGQLHCRVDEIEYD
jgi:exodeoxyribonuclease VII large subunit